MRKHNLHTHTTYSDGGCSPEQLIEFAEKEGLEMIGICDHAFSRKLPEGYQITSCLEEYLSHLRRIQQTSKGVDLKIGIEIDVSMNFGADPRDLPFGILNRFDYILFEYVNTEEEYWGRVGNRDISEIIQVRKEITVPVGLAHNDLQRSYAGREKEIAQMLSKNDIFVELNQSEFHLGRLAGRNTRLGKDYYLYFSPELIKHLAKRSLRWLPFVSDVKFVMGTDSHSGEGVGKIDEAYRFIKDNRLSGHGLVK